MLCSCPIRGAGSRLDRHFGVGSQPSGPHGDPEGDADVLPREGEVGGALAPRHPAGTVRYDNPCPVVATAALILVLFG